jgi:hypothetical protein
VAKPLSSAGNISAIIPLVLVIGEELKAPAKKQWIIRVSIFMAPAALTLKTVRAW